ncbi:MAG: alpha/beta hydrolase domain-containing protein [Bryobacter sp.]|nr:alpha/beta hydrolase domain-containing protein [Bryobacter sp.]
MTKVWIFGILVCSLVLPGCLTGAVTKVHLVDRGDVEGGRAFGKAGAYEFVAARAFFAVDPKLPANQIIRDLDKAKPNAEGKVEFSADIYVLKPRDPALGNGGLVFEVSNRGGKGLLGTFQFAGNDGGDGWLMEQGYTLVWVGWQFDVPKDAKLLRVYPPVAEGVETLIRSEFVPTARTKTMSLGDRNMQPYPAAGPVKLTVRDSRDGKRQAIASGWQLNAEKTAIEMESGFAPWQIYEAVYPAKNLAVAGVGLAAIRDFIAFLRYERMGATLLGDQARWLKRSIAFGTSQSGRLLRQFLYDGFNEDEKGRPVFDGIWANVAGGGRGSFNVRGAQPSRDGHPTFNFFYPSDIFPFTDLPTTDPVTGKSDGILRAGKKAPKIFYTNGSYEYWGRSAALIHITPDGKADAAVAPDTRIYFVAGSQHGPARSLPPSKQATVDYTNMNDYRPLYRALLVALDGWIKDGTAPPASRYPRLDKGELVPFEMMPASRRPADVQRAFHADYSSEPPTISAAFPLLVPGTDADGNEVGGVKMPEVALPLAVYRGWNYRAEPGAPPRRLLDMTGATVPFAKAKVMGLYPTREDYQKRVRAEAERMADERLLLRTDVDRVVKRAGKAYEWILSQP